MLLLLPPSETKQIGGSNLTIQQVHLSYGQLNEARDKVLAKLLELSQNVELAQRALKLSPKQLGDIESNLAIPNAPTMPAYLRYSGTLYKAIDAATFGESEVEMMRRHVLMQSALFGLISSTDRIPWYRLSAETRLPGLDLKKLWQESQLAAWARLVDFPVIDLRSKSYVELSPIPQNIDSFWVEVVAETDGERKALNHFNKKAKGELVGAFVRAKKTPETINDLKKLAKSLGLGLEVEGRKIVLLTSEKL
ncbi:MAG: YaaA family protein [Rhodoluna sp.]